ncbi:MAG TPA: hypothetical protein VHX44_03010, partial [Planctomycetota bacterium]|nr:hypothetical protein [Planctomycetota bacterium]
AGGGWFADAYLMGVMVDALLGVVRHLGIWAIVATYGLGIVSGELSGLHSLTIEGVDATIDLRAVENSSTGGALPPLLELLPNPLPLAALTGDIRLLLPDREVLLSGMHLRIAGDRVSLDVRVQVAEAEPLHVVATFRRPSVDTLRLEHAVVLGDATLETLELVLGRARQQLIGGVQLGGGHLTLQADPANARVVAEGLDLAAIPPSLSALLPTELGALRGTVAGEASAIRSPQGWNVAGSVRVTDLVVAGTGPFGINGQWHLGAGAVQLPHITVNGPAGGQVTIDGLTLLLADRRPRTGAIHATIPDLRPWLPMTLTLSELLSATPVALNADMLMEGDALVIRTARLEGAGVELTVLGSVAAAPWRIEAADVAVRADLATIAGLVPKAPNLAGIVRLRATGTLPLTVDPTRLLATPLDYQVRGDGLMVSSVAIDRLRLDARTGDGRLHLTQGDAMVAGIGVTLTAAGAWQDAECRGTLTSLALTFPGVVATATESCGFTVGSAGWSVGPLRLASDAGALSVEASHHAGIGALVIDAPHLDLGHLGLSEVAGTATVAVDVRGDWSAPVGAVRLLSEDLRIGSRRARANLQLTQDDHGIAIGVGQIDAGEDGVVLATGTLPLRVGRAGVTLVPDDGKPASLEVTVPDLRR